MSLLYSYMKLANYSFKTIRDKIFKIGQSLNHKGGKELMLKIYYRIHDYGENARLLEQIWWEGSDRIE